MKTLYTYIVESKTKFDQFTNKWDKLKKLCPNLHLIKHPDAEKYVKLLTSQLGDDIIYIYADGASYFKIQRGYNDALISLLDNEYKDNFVYSVSNGSISVKYKYPDGKKSNTIFQTGDGSIGRVSTDQQESATCLIWNAFIDNQIDVNNNDIKERDQLVRNLVSSISKEFDNDWIRTFSKHVIAICDYLKYYFGGSVNPSDYKLCLSHKSTLGNDPDGIGDVYGNFVKRYVQQVGGKGAKKDPFDPADVILYKKDSVDYIKSELSSYMNDPVAGKIQYKKNLFDTGTMIGISLKKITGVKKTGKFDIYNDGKSAEKCKRVKSFEIDERTSNKQVVVNCKGDFDFDSTTTEDGQVVGKETVVSVVLRSFGSVAMDCTIQNGGPTLGKCPVAVWRSILGVDVNDPLEKCVEKFKNYLETTPKPKLLKTLKILIAASIKQGEHCFPFVLIH